jgi:hypothetical protein
MKVRADALVAQGHLDRDRERGRDFDDRLPELGAPLPASRDPRPAAQPAIRALDLPAMPALRVGALEPLAPAPPDLAGRRAGRDRFAFAAGAADPRGDPALLELRLQLGGGVAAVGPELGGPQAALEQLVDERQQLAALVLVGGPDPDREGGAARLDG